MEILALLTFALFSTFPSDSESLSLKYHGLEVQNSRVRRDENGNKLEFSIDVIPSEGGSPAHHAGSHVTDGSGAEGQMDLVPRKRRDLFAFSGHKEIEHKQVHERSKRSESSDENESSGGSSSTDDEDSSEEVATKTPEKDVVGLVPGLVGTLGGLLG